MLLQLINIYGSALLCSAPWCELSSSRQGRDKLHSLAWAIGGAQDASSGPQQAYSSWWPAVSFDVKSCPLLTSYHLSGLVLTTSCVIFPLSLKQPWKVDSIDLSLCLKDLSERDM